MIKPHVVNKLKSIHEVKLLMYFSGIDEWKHNKENRQFLADMLFIAEITLKCMLRTLLDKGFITKASKGIYKINKDILT